MEMDFQLKRGRGTETFSLEDSRILQVILPPETNLRPCTLRDVEEALDSPVGTPPLLELLQRKQPRKIVLIVNDITRPTPYDLLLPPVLSRFARAGITDDMVTLLVATGIHDPHTDDQNLQVYGEEIVRRFGIVSHAADDLESLVSIGTLSTGAELKINRWWRRPISSSLSGWSCPTTSPDIRAAGSPSCRSGVEGDGGAQPFRMVELMDALPDWTPTR